MTVLVGHLTPKNKQAIREVLKVPGMTGKVGNTTYLVYPIKDGSYLVKMVKRDRGLIPCPGSPLRTSVYQAVFKF